MIYTNKITPVVISITMLMVSATVYAQQFLSTNPKLQDNSYYLSFDTEHFSASITSLPNEKLSLRYYDQYALTRQMVVSIFDWQGEPMGKFQLNKARGVNYFNINLKDLRGEWEKNQVYYCRATDDGGNELELPFRIVEFAAEKPEVDIFVNPINAGGCKDITTSSISYISKIKGGKPPYNLTWYVITNTLSDLLFLPREDHLQQETTSSMISVEAQLDYYVLLHVEDACGNKGKQMVHVLCEEEKDQINTIFVQPLADISKLKH